MEWVSDGPSLAMSLPAIPLTRLRGLLIITAALLLYDMGDMKNTTIQRQQVVRQQNRTGLRMILQYSEIHTLFDELIHKKWGHHIWQPLMDIWEEEERFTIQVDLPGVDVETINVSIAKTKVLIDGQRPQAEKDKEAAITVCERPRGIFVREIELFQELSDEPIEMHYDDGVLTLEVQKAGIKNRSQR